MEPLPPHATGRFVEPDGTQRWYRKGALHREDGPAVVYANGGTEWWRDGALHRDKGPAIERADGTREWWVRGEQKPPPKRRS